MHMFGKRSSRVAKLCGFVAITSLVAAHGAFAGSKPDAKSRPDLQGIWASTLTSLNDPRWSVENIICADCSLESVEHMEQLLNDSGKGKRSLKDIEADVTEYNKNFVAGLLTQSAREFQSKFKPIDDPVLNCQPVGFIYQVQAVLPLKIEQFNDRVVFKYELFNAERTVYLDGRGHPGNLAPTALGHSIGWYDGPTLVIETQGLAANIALHTIMPGIRTSDHASAVERYTRSADGQKLDGELTIIDPHTFIRPFTLKLTFVADSNDKLQRFECKVRSGVADK